MHVMGMLTARLGAKPLHECGAINDDDGSFISTLASRVERDRFERDGHGQHAFRGPSNALHRSLIRPSAVPYYIPYCPLLFNWCNLA